MDFCYNGPLNSTSFGQTSIGILRELYRRKVNVPIFPIGSGTDLSAQKDDPEFFEWIQKSIDCFYKVHDRDIPSLKLWHLNGGLESVSKKQTLLTFYELDEPTESELNIAKNNNTVFTSHQSVDVFKQRGVETSYVPLAFDSDNFKILDDKFHEDGRIVFNLSGKLERRKRHEKAIRAWVKRFGNDKRYFLHCSIYNHFMNADTNNALLAKILQDKHYFNVNFLPFMAKNLTYNEYLNSANIILGVSGGEGWGLPEFQSVALGKYGVIMDAHGYKSWANDKNSILIKPSEKIDSYDNVFFKRGADFNQGKIFDFDEDEFINACELAISKYQENSVNEEGVKLQKEFTFKRTVDSLLELI
jgi:glycosyltransferase involved in cell wall biosynthesis